MTERRTLYPPIEPFATGMLDVGDGHYALLGAVRDRGAKPAVFLTGVLAAARTRTTGRQFDPALYDRLAVRPARLRRSTPHASLHANTTLHLVADIERLRELAGHEQWLVFGGSWGSTLSLAYAQAHPAARHLTRPARHFPVRSI
jgi:proline iminopeptidase